MHILLEVEQINHSEMLFNFEYKCLQQFLITPNHIIQTVQNSSHIHTSFMTKKSFKQAYAHICILNK